MNPMFAVGDLVIVTHGDKKQEAVVINLRIARNEGKMIGWLYDVEVLETPALLEKLSDDKLEARITCNRSYIRRL